MVLLLLSGKSLECKMLTKVKCKLTRVGFCKNRQKTLNLKSGLVCSEIASYENIKKA